MEEADAAPAPAVPRPLRLAVPTLRELCANVLARYPHCLGDIGYMDVDSLRTVAWSCNVEQLARIEDETLSGSDRNLEWYTWHLWKRLLTVELGLGGMQAPPLQSPQPVDYSAPRGINDEPADYRALYMQRKAEVDRRAAAARERIAAANRVAQEMKDSHKAKMIDKLAPAKRQRSGAGGRAAPPAASSAFLHKPRPDSRSTLLSKPGAQLKLLKDLGLVKPAAQPSKPVASVRIVRPAPVPAAATGHSSSLAGAELLAKATGGQLGRASVGGGRGHVEAQPPQAAARAAAVAAAAAARNAAAAPPSQASGVKRQASGAAEPALHPSKASKTAPGSPGGAARPDPRVMFPRQPPPQSSPGQSKFAVPTVRPLSASAGAGPPPPLQHRGAGLGAGAAGKSPLSGRAGAAGSRAVAAGGMRAGLRPVDDL